MSVHARLSPSNKRWPHCAGSVREEKNYPDISGDAAIDGTGSHVQLESCVKNNVPASYYDGQIIGIGHEDKPQGWLVNMERCNRVQICLDYIARRKTELTKLYPGCIIDVQTESISNPGTFFKRRDWFGTCDITITVLLNGNVVFIEVIDYKDGRMYVSEKWDTQLISYLFGKIIRALSFPADISEIGMRMTIVQPKTGTPIRYMCSLNPDHGLNKSTFMEKVNWLAERAAATDDPNAPLTAGKHCTWCKHNPKRGGSCTALIQESTEVIQEMTNDLTTLSNDKGLLELMVNAVSDIDSISPENLAKIADIEPGLSAVFSKVKGKIQEKIEAGVNVPGYEVGPGKAKKVWNEDEETIVKKLKGRKFKKDDIYPSKLITPAAALAAKHLTDAQREKLKKDLISEVAGNNVLKKVAYEKPEKDVSTMFLDVGEKPKEETVSFF